MIGRSFSLFFSIFFSRCCTRIIGHVLHGNLKVQNAFTVVVFKGFCVLFFKCIYFILLTRFVILLLVVKIFFSIVIYILLTIKCFFWYFLGRGQNFNHTNTIPPSTQATWEAHENYFPPLSNYLAATALWRAVCFKINFFIGYKFFIFFCSESWI